MAEVPDAIADASAAFSSARAAGSADVSGQLGDRLGQYPVVRELMQAATSKIPQLIDAVQELHGAIDQGAVSNLAQAAQANDRSREATAGSPVSVQKLQGATQKLKTAADLSDLAAKAEAALGDASVVSATREWSAAQTQKPNMQEVRGALASVDLNQIGVVGQIEAVTQSVQQAGHTLPADSQAAVEHLRSELGQITDSLRRDLGRIVSACDRFVAALA
jgi:hypothetical protein